MSDDVSELSEAELAEKILESAEASDEMTARVPCRECGHTFEFDMENVFEYVLRKKYGMRSKDLEKRRE
ncbi:hypothetical protein [Halorarum halobium]|uniref:hypothetical protein n=1 Tax=Halorarum halobium TaxID=3075121 RepID=UPI0028A8C194|nr:hypothetical protein [Halobaculum sp. XH14]